MKRTLRRELKVPEIAEREANGTSASWLDCLMRSGLPVVSAKAAQGVLNGLHWVFLALRVNAGLVMNNTLEEWSCCCGGSNASSRSHCHAG